MKIIGISINEAIDWTQDLFLTTRPIAEKTLFSLLKDRSVKETEEGYVLVEEEGEEPEKHFANIKNNMSKNWSRRTRVKFHTKRKGIHIQNMEKKELRKKGMHLDESDEAEGMMVDDESSENQK
jgi:hypothetical protein